MMRACQPVSDGYVERDGVKIHYEVFGAGEPTVLLLPTWSIIPLAALEDAGPLPCPALPRAHVRRARQRPLGPARRSPRRMPRASSRPTRIAVMDATQTERAVIVGFSMGGQRGLLLAANHPERVEAAVFIGPSYSGRRRATARANGALVGGRARHRRGLGEVQQALLAPRLPGLPRVLLVADVHRAALDQAVRGRRRLGPRDDGRDAGSHLPGPGI